MAISGDISGTSKEKLNGKLGLETLEKRRWYRKLCCFIRTSVSTTLNSHNPKGFKLLIRLSLASSHLREHKFEHSFQDSLNAICSCGNDIEMSAHYLLQCPNFSNERPLFLNIIGSIDKNILKRNDLQVTETLLTTIVIQTI